MMIALSAGIWAGSSGLEKLDKICDPLISRLIFV